MYKKQIVALATKNINNIQFNYFLKFLPQINRFHIVNWLLAIS